MWHREDGKSCKHKIIGDFRGQLPGKLGMFGMISWRQTDPEEWIHGKEFIHGQAGQSWCEVYTEVGIKEARASVSLQGSFLRIRDRRPLLCGRNLEPSMQGSALGQWATHTTAHGLLGAQSSDLRNAIHQLKVVQFKSVNFSDPSWLPGPTRQDPQTTSCFQGPAFLSLPVSWIPASQSLVSFSTLLLLLVVVFFFFLAVPHCMWDLSSPTRDWTGPPWIESTES